MHNQGGITMRVHTYADGFGRWHAVVPAVGSVGAQRERARRAIAAEVRARQYGQRPVIRLGATPPALPRRGSPIRVWAEAA
jgi:hypothetical protein